MPAFTLAELAALQKSTQKTPKTLTSPAPQTPAPTSPNLETALGPALPKMTKTTLQAFEAGIGGRQHLIEILELSSLDKKQEHLLNLLVDPRRASDTIDTIVRDAGMKPAHIIELARSSAFAQAHAIALTHMAQALPGVVTDIAAKSVDAKIECPTCFGAKEIQHIACPTCYGKGEVMRYSDLDRQKILLESAGVTKKGGGVNVNVNQQVGIVNPGGFFSTFVKNSDADAYAIDVTAEEVKD